MQQFENTPYLDKYQSRKSADIQRVQKYLAEETKLAIEKGISKDLPVDFLIRTGSGLIISTIKFLHENRIGERVTSSWNKPYKCICVRTKGN